MNSENARIQSEKHMYENRLASHRMRRDLVSLTVAFIHAYSQDKRGPGVHKAVDAAAQAYARIEEIVDEEHDIQGLDE